MPKLSAKIGTGSQLADPTGVYLHVIKDDGVGGYDSYVMEITDFLSALQTQVTSLQGRVGIKYAENNLTGNTELDLSAGTKLVSITIQHVSGTVNVDIGTTNGGTEISEGYNITGGTEELIINQIYESAQNIYITRNSGTYNVIFYYFDNWV